MALQVALNQLRHSTDGKVNKKDEGECSSRPLKPVSNFDKSSSAPLFTVDEAELFNFSDDDFPIDDDVTSFLLPSTISTSAKTTTVAMTTNSAVRSSDSQSGATTVVAASATGGCLATDKSSSIYGATKSIACSQLNQPSQSSSAEFSPSSKTIEKLRNFKFVKTSKSTANSHSKRPMVDNQSELTPPPSKRRPVCNDVTNHEPISTKSTASDYDDTSTSGSQQITFKQPSVHPPRTTLTSEGQRSEVTSKVTMRQKQNVASNSAPGIGDISSSNSSSISASSGIPPNVPMTPTHSNAPPRSARLSTPLSTVTNSTSRLTTPQIPSHMIQTTPTLARGRQTTPLVCTPTGGVVTTPISRAAVPIKRKFPGPAGLLPSLAPGQSMDNLYIPPPSTPVPASTPREQRLSYTCTASSVPSGDVSASQCVPEDITFFTQRPWTDMMKDLDLADTQSSVLLQYNISSSLKQASSKQLKNGKVAHLRSVIKSIVPAGKNASALLKDPTGEIMCIFHSKVVEDYQKELHPGAVLLLRQVSVFSPSPRKHYLNITPSNIVRIYPAHSPGSEKQPRPLLRLSDMIREREENETSDVSQCTPSSSMCAGLHLSTASRLRGYCSTPSPSQSSQTKRDSNRWTVSSQRNTRTVCTTSIPGNRTSGSFQALSKGVSSVLATRKANTFSSDTNKTRPSAETVNKVESSSVASSSHPDEALMDDLPCDFDDFSDDDDDGGMEVIQTASITEKDKPAVSSCASVAVEKDSDCSTVRNSGKAKSSTECGFFNKLCEDEFDSLMNDISDDGFDF